MCIFQKITVSLPPYSQLFYHTATTCSYKIFTHFRMKMIIGRNDADYINLSSTYVLFETRDNISVH